MSDQSETTRRIIEPVPYAFLEGSIQFIRDSLYGVAAQYHLRNEQMVMWMPEYFVVMLSKHMQVTYNSAIHNPLAHLDGCDIVIGYENKIIIGHKKCVESGYKPLELQIP